LLGTWEENAAGFTVGETVVGIVRSVEEYGTFIEIAPNLAGLAHPLCLSTGKPVHRLSGLVGVQRLNDKAGGAAYPGQYGNV
ncbi:hypothetical protein ACSTB0_13670, partial [Faecalibacterium wellingii]